MLRHEEIVELKIISMIRIDVLVVSLRFKRLEKLGCSGS